MQNISMMPTVLRQNSRILIFTAESAATEFFGNRAAGQTHNKKQAELAAKTTFKSGQHNKLVFDPEEGIFYHTLATLRSSFRCGSPAYRKFLDSLPSKSVCINDKFLK